MDVTNHQFARDNEEFIEACARAGVLATQRQASKFRNKKGRAYKARRAPQSTDRSED